MGAIGFYLFYAINWVITLLPLRVLYIFSDFLFLLLYYFPSYRRKVVGANLRNSFPEKTREELRSIEKKFYHHLADLFVETFKLTHMSQAELSRRFTISNLELTDRLYEQKRDIIAILGHYNNWEFPLLLPTYFKSQMLVIYKPLQNKYFNRYINSQRTRYGLMVTPMSMVLRDIINFRKKNIQTITAVISDQTPVKSEIKYWTTFLNQDTPVFTGAEKIASKYDMAVVFFNVQKIKRGYYNLDIELLFEHTAGLHDNVITEGHVRRLEEIVREKPEFWVWSHRRWKHKRPVVNE